MARPLLLVYAAGGKRILIDPVLSSYRTRSPSSIKRLREYPWRAESMPEIDLLIISHDHYDHLDYATIKALLPKVKRVVTPAGRGVASALLGDEP